MPLQRGLQFCHDILLCRFITESDLIHVQILVKTGFLIFGRRLGIGLSAVPISAFFVHPRPEWEGFGGVMKILSLMLVLSGLCLRAWSAGCAGDHTRTGNIEAPRLVTGGPYSYVRNPIYLGSMALGLGMIGLIGDPWMLLPYAFVFALLYFSIIPAEEEFLLDRFGDQYQLFRQNVPRLIPRLAPWAQVRSIRFKWSSALKEWRIAAVLILVLVTVFAISHFRG